MRSGFRRISEWTDRGPQRWNNLLCIPVYQWNSQELNWMFSSQSIAPSATAHPVDGQRILWVIKSMLKGLQLYLRHSTVFKIKKLDLGTESYVKLSHLTILKVSCHIYKMEQVYLSHMVNMNYLKMLCSGQRWISGANSDINLFGGLDQITLICFSWF